MEENIPSGLLQLRNQVAMVKLENKDPSLRKVKPGGGVLRSAVDSGTPPTSGPTEDLYEKDGNDDREEALVKEECEAEEEETDEEDSEEDPEEDDENEVGEEDERDTEPEGKQGEDQQDHDWGQQNQDGGQQPQSTGGQEQEEFDQRQPMPEPQGFGDALRTQAEPPPDYPPPAEETRSAVNKPKSKGLAGFFRRSKAPKVKEPEQTLPQQQLPPSEPSTSGISQPIVYQPQSFTQNPKGMKNLISKVKGNKGKSAMPEPSPPAPPCRPAPPAPPGGPLAPTPRSAFGSVAAAPGGLPTLGGPSSAGERRDGTDTPLSFTSTASHMSAIPVGFGIAYLNFIPKDEDNFGDLMERANAWLSSSLSFKAISFETLKVPINAEGEIDPDQSLQEVTAETVHCVVLRMWVVVDSEMKAQRIRHINLLTKWTKGQLKGNSPTMPSSELCDDTLARFNADIIDGLSLGGKILCMETLNYLHAFHNKGIPMHLDPEVCQWTDINDRDVNILSILRIYVVDEPGATPEVIGVQDFVPECTQKGDLSSMEAFDKLVKVASAWVKFYKGLRVTNLQTVNRMLETENYDGSHISTRQTLLRHRHNCPTHYIRFLRVYYAQSTDNSPEGPRVDAPASLEYTDFMPDTPVPSQGQLKITRRDPMKKVVNNMNAFINQTACDVISVETLELLDQGRLTFDPEVSFVTKSNQSDTTNHFLFAFRVYTDAECTIKRDSAEAGAGAGNEDDEDANNDSESVVSYDFAAWPHAHIPPTYKMPN